MPCSIWRGKVPDERNYRQTDSLPREQGVWILLSKHCAKGFAAMIIWRGGERAQFSGVGGGVWDAKWNDNLTRNKYKLDV